MFIENDDEENKQNSVTGNNPTTVGAGGGGGSISGASNTEKGNPSTINPVQSNQPQQKFATTQDYLKANQTQGENLGNAFTTNNNQSLGTEKSSIDTAANKTQGDINSGTVNYDSNLINTAVSDPTKITGDPNQMTAFLNQYNAAYTGPQSFAASTNYTDAANAANAASNKAAELKTTGGQQQLLKDQFGQTNQGGSNLDVGILQNSSAEPTIQNQQKQFSGVTDYLNNQETNLDTAATNAANTTAATKQQAQGAFANNLTNFQNGINSQVQNAQNAATTAATAYTNALKSGDATQVAAALQNSNLTTAQKSNLQDYLSAINKDYGSNPDLSSYYTFNPATDITAANVATPEDYAKAAAYNQLTGVDYSGVLNPTNASQAGTAGNANTGLNADAAGQTLQQYLIQKEQESLTPQGTPGGSSPTNNDTQKDALKSLGSAATIANPVTALTTAGTALGVQKLGQKLSDSLGFGAQHKDVNVNLPALNLPSMAIPQGATAATTKLLTDVYNTPIKDAGSYHEGAVGDIVSRLDSLQSALKSGQLTQDQYVQYAQPLAQWANQAYNTIMSSGQTAGKSVQGSYPSFTSKYGNLLQSATK